MLDFNPFEETQEAAMVAWLRTFVGSPFESIMEQFLDRLCETFYTAEYERVVRING